MVKRCLANNAANIILAHNHPSGDSAPSPADREITHLLKNGVGLSRHPVARPYSSGQRRNFSFAEAG